MFIGFFKSYRLTSKEILHPMMSGVIFSTDQSETNLPYLKILKLSTG